MTPCLPDAALGLRPDPAFLSRWCAASERRLGSANAQDLAHMAWAMATIGYRPSMQWCQRYEAGQLQGDVPRVMQSASSRVALLVRLPVTSLQDHSQQ